MQANETHEKIIEVLKNKGPSLPIQIAKELSINSLFISAFLSELADEKRIRVSHLKVGGSPLYFLEGQEEKLEPYYKYLHPKEAETFLLLKKNKLLKDSEQEPAIRVALRSIRDFAVGFKKNEEIYWKYILIPENEIREILEPKETKKESKQKEKSKNISEPKPQETIISKKDIKNEFQNPLIISTKKTKKQKPKSEFVQRIINFLNQNNLKIIQEKDFKAKEYNCIVQIRSELGLIDFLTQAKNKKTISESDLKKLLSNAQKIPLPAFLLYTQEISKKAKEYLNKYSSILKVKKIE